MSIKQKEIKTYLHGRRRMLFDRLKAKKETSVASLLREILDFYFENHPDGKP